MPYKDRAAKLQHDRDYYAAHKDDMLRGMRDRARAVRAGTVKVQAGDRRAQLLRHIEQQDGHWLWTGHRDPKGYGRVNIAGITQLAHRASYEEFKGPIPEGMTLDHLCRVHECVNPNHLEPVTALENWTRGIPGQTKGWCRRGHDTAIEGCWVDGRYIYCRACRRQDRAVRKGVPPAGR